MSRTACREPQCLYSTAIPLLSLWAVRPVQSLSACTVRPVQSLAACTRVHIFCITEQRKHRPRWNQQFLVFLRCSHMHMGRLPTKAVYLALFPFTAVVLRFSECSASFHFRSLLLPFFHFRLFLPSFHFYSFLKNVPVLTLLFYCSLSYSPNHLC